MKREDTSISTLSNIGFDLKLQADALEEDKGNLQILRKGGFLKDVLEAQTSTKKESSKEQIKYQAKTEATELLYETVTPPHLICANCGYDIDAWDFWEEVILEQIQRQKKTDSDHLLRQMDRATELFFAECPECGEVRDFRGESR